MKPFVSTATTLDTLPGKEIEFKVAATEMRWIMESLSDLYSDKALATIRELSTNARDSHVAAGRKDVPIEVTLPSELNPYFTIKDTGLGLSMEELEEIYTQFGKSTKRDSNDFNGILGFGSKAPIAFSDTFTVTAIKDGIKNSCVVTRKPEGGVFLKVVMSDPTAESNGVMIEVPVREIAEFNSRAKRFYEFWEAGTVEINGVLNEGPEGKWVSDTAVLTPKRSPYGEGEIRLVMGGVTYPLDRNMVDTKGLKFKQDVSVFVANGSVEFVPSRESLKYTGTTKQAITDVLSDLREALIEAITKDVDSAPTLWQALDIFLEWASFVHFDEMSNIAYDGTRLSGTKRIDFPSEATIYQLNLARNAVSKRTSVTFGTWSDDSADNILFVADFSMTVVARHKRAVERYVREKCSNRRISRVVFVQEGSIASGWVNPDWVVSWLDVLSYAPASKKKMASGTFEKLQYIPSGLIESVEEEPTGDGTGEYYVTPSTGRQMAHNTLRQGESVWVIPKNRLAKFKRLMPKVSSYRDKLRSELVLDESSLYTKDEVDRLRVSNTDVKLYGILSAAGTIDDPELIFNQNVTPISKDSQNKVRRNKVVANALGATVTRVEPGKSVYFEKYPIFRDAGSYYISSNASRYLEYVNAVYAARRKND